MEKNNINSEWNMWYHSITDDNWKKDSYKKIITIKNLFDYHFLKYNYERQHLQNGMFFIMRGDIFPTWEDPDNRMGGCISFKINSDNILDAWNNLFLQLICETITLKDTLFDEINGISISPKKEFNIIKIWIRNDNNNYKDLLNNMEPYFKITESLYKKHELEY
mgnify:CR=1 FL=1